MSTTWEGAKFDPVQLRKYRELCHVPSGDSVPLLYPHSFLGPLHLQLLARPEFPLQLMGAVHSRNHVVRRRAMSASAPFDVRLEMREHGRRRPQGFEMDLVTELSVEGEVAWESVSTFLVRQKCAEEDAEHALAAAVAKIAGEPQRVGEFPVPPNTGKAFGLLTKDINPIHMNRLAARLLFGFERDLAHGMWTAGRTLPFFGEVDLAAPVRLDCAFKGPCYMERDVRVLAADAAQPGRAFEVYSGTNPRPSIVGRLANVSATETILV